MRHGRRGRGGRTGYSVDQGRAQNNRFKPR